MGLKSNDVTKCHPSRNDPVLNSFDPRKQFRLYFEAISYFPLEKYDCTLTAE